MKSLASAILFVLLLSGPGPLVQAAEPVRVEIIVFHHAEGRSDRWPSDNNGDFGSLTDPLERARLAVWTARRTPGEFPGGSPAAISDLPGPYSIAHLERLATSASRVSGPYDQTPIWPDHHVGLSSLSSTMQRALERLDRSGDYVVLSATGWLQPLDRQMAAVPVRVRGHQAVQVHWTQLIDQGLQIEGPVAPPPARALVDYRLDGSLQLRQRQFRHVDLELVWTERVVSEDEPALALHRLSQSRPIRLGRMEYFDSAWLGALVLVEEWQRPAASEPTQPDS